MVNITKEKLIKFMTNRFDVDLKEIYEGLNLTPEDLPHLDYLLDELINEKWIVSVGSGFNKIEYDPGEKQDFGGIRG